MYSGRGLRIGASSSFDEKRTTFFFKVTGAVELETTEERVATLFGATGAKADAEDARRAAAIAVDQVSFMML
jgi:hypothetical protein